jgi:hypothetical protein
MKVPFREYTTNTQLSSQNALVMPIALEPSFIVSNKRRCYVCNGRALGRA